MARRSTKADMIAKMLAEGFTAPQIKKRMKVSESYVYAVKKQMEKKPFTPEELGVSEETLIEVALAASQGKNKLKPGEFIQADTNVDAILNARGSRYGNFLDHARVTYKLKEVARNFAEEKGKTFAVDQCEAMDMIFHKIGRILNGDPNYADSWIDIAGYAKLVADRLEGKVR
jgi:transposase